MDPEIEQGLVESEPDADNAEVVLSWEGGGIPRSLTAIATQARTKEVNDLLLELVNFTVFHWINNMFYLGRSRG